MFVILVVVGFTLTIFVHELGHFITARKTGMYVEAFSIGIGPKLFEVYKDKKGTSYILSLIPFGGYVKIKGQEDLPLKKEERKTDTDSFINKPPLSRFIVIVAGVIMNVVFAYILLSAVYIVGIRYIPNKIGGVRPKSPAAFAGFKEGDVIIQIGSTEIETGEDIKTQAAFSESGKNKKIVYLRNGEKKQTVLTPQSLSRGGLPVVNDFGFILWSKPVIREISAEDSLYKAGFRSGMTVHSLTLVEVSDTDKTGDDFMGHQRLSGHRDLQKSLKRISSEKRTISSMIELIKEHPGEWVYITAKSNRNADIKHAVVKIDSQKDRTKGFETEPKIMVIEGYGAAKAGLLSGDVVKNINGRSISNWETLREIVAHWTNASGHTVTVLRGTNTLTFDVEADYIGEAQRYMLGVSLAPSARVTAVAPELQGKPNVFEPGDQIQSVEEQDEKMLYTYMRDGRKKALSVSLNDLPYKTRGFLFHYVPDKKLVKYGFPKVFLKSMDGVRRELLEVIAGLKGLFGGGLSIKMFGGPLKIFNISYQVGVERGIAWFTMFFVKIGIGLAVVNFLPIPPLDGGYAVFILAEMITGKEPSRNVFLAFQVLGTVLILSFFIVIMFHDIQSMFF